MLPRCLNLPFSGHLKRTMRLYVYVALIISMLSIPVIFKLVLEACVLNAQSICNKVCDLHDIVSERHLDIMVMTESWLKPEHPDYHLKVKEICPDNYSYLSCPRSKRSEAVFP